MNLYLQSHKFKRKDGSPFYLFKISSSLQRGNSLPLVPVFSQRATVNRPIPFLCKISTKILVVTDEVTRYRFDLHQTKFKKILDATLNRLNS